MTRVFVDTNVLLYFSDKQSEFHYQVINLFAQFVEQKFQMVITPFVLNELHYCYFRKFGAQRAAQLTNAVFQLPGFVMEDVTLQQADIVELGELAQQYNLRTFDAMHVLYCKKLGIKKIFSYDKHFDKVQGLERIFQL